MLLLRLVRAGVMIGLAMAVIYEAQPITLAGIHGYQTALAPMVTRAGVECRFTPTCSRYAEVVIERDGVVRGGWLALKRIARCGPWTPRGTRDDP
ncbi:MAG TPA: membrane protein insertion efficiency factor YidD [Rhodanobacteraceae bacterium]